MMPAPHDEHGLADGRWGPEDAVAGDRHRLVQARARVGHRVGQRVQHRGVGDHLLGPAPAEALSEPERAAGRDHPAVEVEARRRPAARAVRTRRVDAPRRAGDTRVDRNPCTGLVRALGSRFHDAARDLVAEDEGK